MTDLNLSQAREWADSVSAGPATDRAHAAAKLIQSLPDQWVDEEKLKAIIADMDHCLKMESTSDFSRGIDSATTSWRDALKTLLMPKLPTLADMTQEEREACQWMQAKVEGFSEDERLVIAFVDEYWIMLWREDGDSIRTNPGAVTPLPGPKLKWPGSEPEPTHFDNLPDEAKQVMKESIEEYKAGQFVDFDSSPRPEDVPEGEPWIVQHEGVEGVGCRNEPESSLPWLLIRRDEHQFDYCYDTDITLVSRLVPEIHALPEGMRLADHEEYGRVVVSPKDDLDSDYRVFCSQDHTEYGADWWYAHKSELTFLGGEA